MGNTDFFDDDLIKKRVPVRGPGGVLPGASDELPSKQIADLNLTRMAKHRQEMGAQAASTAEELETLNRRKDELERQRRMIEDITRQQNEYESGRRELADRLSQGAAMLEKQEIQAARLVELYATTQARFKDMLGELRAVNEEDWDDAKFRDELSRAVALIDSMRKEYSKAMARVEAAEGGGPLSERAATRVEGGGLEGGAEPHGALYWMKMGFAFCLPLMVFLLVCLIAGWILYLYS